MMKKLIECVPNFSEGRDEHIIRQITSAISSVDGVDLLDVDPGKATNRTVVTFVGEPEAVVEAAFRGIKMASELIDMSIHQGEHPRMGATDVCPFIPVQGVSMEEAVVCAKKLAERVGQELAVPVYLYGAAQDNKERSDLSVIRSGEYEGFFDKIKLPEWKPDFGPAKMNARSGASVIGARDFLIAYNVNLNTKSTRIANRIAFDVREAGRVLRKGNPFTGELILDEAGQPLRQPGKCKDVKAIGWYIEEYGIAQISANLTNYRVTPLHVFFDEVCNSAFERGVRVTGSELVGLIPLQAMLDAGKYFLEKQGRSTGVPESELIHIAVKSLGLDELQPFDPNKKIIEYRLKTGASERLISLSCKEFADLTSGDSPAPGGGSVSALVGAFGAALAAMMANLSAGKRGWEDKTKYFSDWADKAQHIKDRLLYLVDEDTRAFDRVMEAFQLPKNTEEEMSNRKAAIQEATKYAAQIPLEVMQTAALAFDLIETMVDHGNQNSVSDGLVGGMCCATAFDGARMNVLINIKGIDDLTFSEEMRKSIDVLMAQREQFQAFLQSRIQQLSNF